jgi:hypothetical protein
MKHMEGPDIFQSSSLPPPAACKGTPGGALLPVVYPPAAGRNRKGGGGGLRRAGLTASESQGLLCWLSNRMAADCWPVLVQEAPSTMCVCGVLGSTTSVSAAGRPSTVLDCTPNLRLGPLCRVHCTACKGTIVLKGGLCAHQLCCWPPGTPRNP